MELKDAHALFDSLVRVEDMKRRDSRHVEHVFTAQLHLELVQEELFSAEDTCR